MLAKFVYTGRLPTYTRGIIIATSTIYYYYHHYYYDCYYLPLTHFYYYYTLNFYRIESNSRCILLGACMCKFLCYVIQIRSEMASKQHMFSTPFKLDTRPNKCYLCVQLRCKMSCARPLLTWVDCYFERAQYTERTIVFFASIVMCEIPSHLG